MARQRTGGDFCRMLRREAEYPQHACGVEVCLSGVGPPLENGPDESQECSSGCSQRDLGIADAEAAAFDAAQQVAARIRAEGRGDEVVRDLEPHEQPAKLGVFRGAPDQRPVRGGNDLRRVVQVLRRDGDGRTSRSKRCTPRALTRPRTGNAPCGTTVAGDGSATPPGRGRDRDGARHRCGSWSLQFSAPIVVIVSALRRAACSGGPRAFCPGVRPPGLLHSRGGVQSSAGGIAGRSGVLDGARRGLRTRRAVRWVLAVAAPGERACGEHDPAVTRRPSRSGLTGLRRSASATTLSDGLSGSGHSAFI
jgi:hypothetical protein